MQRNVIKKLGEKMILSSLLSSSKYIIINKDLIKILCLNEAVILGELCSEYTYW